MPPRDPPSWPAWLGQRASYPLGREMLALFAGLGMLLMLSNAPGLIGLFFALAFWVMAYKLGVEALVNTAHGRYQPLGVGELVASDGDALRQLALQALSAVVVLAGAAWLGPVAGVLLLVGVLGVLPAATMLLAVDGRFFAALNPVAWIGIATRVGADYVVLVVLLALLAGVDAGLSWWLERWPYGIGMLPSGMASAYLLVLGFHLMGDVLHRHHAALGLDIAPAISRSTFDNPLEDEAVAAAQALADRGEPAAAAERLRLLFRGRDASHAVHDLYRKHLLAAGDLEELARHDREDVARRLASGQARQALAIAADTSGRVPDFLPADAATALALSRLAALQGPAALVVALGDGAARAWPSAPETYELELAACRVRVERLGREAEAAHRLDRLLASQPGHRLEPEATALRALAQRLAPARP